MSDDRARSRPGSRAGRAAALPVGHEQPGVPRLPRRRVGTSGPRRCRGLRAAVPGRIPVRAVLADDPAQAGQLPRRVRRLPDRDRRRLRRRRRRPAASRSRHRPQPGQDRGGHRQRPGRAQAPGRPGRAGLVIRRPGQGRQGARADARRSPRGHRGIKSAGRRAQAGRIRLRRPGDRLLDHAGLRCRGRPPGRLLPPRRLLPSPGPRPIDHRPQANGPGRPAAAC